MIWIKYILLAGIYLSLKNTINASNANSMTYYGTAQDDEVEIIKDRPFEFNRKVKKERIENENNKDFSLVKGENSELIIIERY